LVKVFLLLLPVPKVLVAIDNSRNEKENAEQIVVEKKVRLKRWRLREFSHLNPLAFSLLPLFSLHFTSVPIDRAMNFFWSLVLFSSLAILGQALTPSSFFSTVDRSRLKSVFDAAVSDKSADLSDLHYAILGYKLLGETAPNAQDLCKKMEAKLDAKSMSSVFHWAVAGKELKCAIKASADVSKVRMIANVSPSSRLI
jgi:hypothetical protein